MPAWQQPGPIDRLFFIAEEASRRLRLPGVTAYVHLHLAGGLNERRLERAITGLGRVYPVLNARPQMLLRDSLPRWRLPEPGDAPRLKLHLHDVAEGRAALHAHFETLLNAPHDIWREPALAFHLFRQTGAGDVLVMRWTHALMDGGGAVALLAALERLYRDDPPLESLRSAGDERRRDFAKLLADVPLGRRLAMLAGLTRDVPGAAPGVQLTEAPYPDDWGPQRLLVRPVTPEEAAGATRAAQALGDGVRLSDWLRASAVAALHSIVGERRASTDASEGNAPYTLMAYVDHRRTHPGAVCWNFNAALPLSVPVADAGRPADAARLLRWQMGAHLAADTGRRDGLSLLLVTRAPLWLIGRIAARAHRPGARPKVRGFRAPLSIPFGIMRWPDPAEFAGLPIAQAYAWRAAPLQPGYAIDVTLLADRPAVVGVCFERRVPYATLATLVERTIAIATGGASATSGAAE